jgi:hypothetical protein
MLAAGISASALHAHHASNLIYDEAAIGTIEGVVEDVFWANPHIHVYLAVANADGSSDTWDMEGPNLASLRRQGVSEGMIRIGDELRITGTLGRNGTKRIWADAIVKTDGTVVLGAP